MCHVPAVHVLHATSFTWCTMLSPDYGQLTAQLPPRKLRRGSELFMGSLTRDGVLYKPFASTPVAGSGGKLAISLR